MTYKRGIDKPGRAEKPESLDIVEFARTRLQFEPDERQGEMLRSEAKRGILNCTRQWGKVDGRGSEGDASRLQPGRKSDAGGESERTAERGVPAEDRGDGGDLGIRPRGDGDHATSLLFPNGSRIVGLPGTDATVRGFSAVSLLLIDEAARGWRMRCIRRCVRCWRWAGAICG